MNNEHQIDKGRECLCNYLLPAGRSKSGFTLIEMLVTITIMTLFMTGMLLRGDDFDETVRFSSLAREAALIVREAQTYGAGGASGTDLGRAHGIYLDDSSSKEIKLYVNDPDSTSKKYQSSTGDQILDTLNLPEAYEVADFCLEESGTVSDCGSADTNPSDLSIYFVRPSLEANFACAACSSDESQAAIKLIHNVSGSVKYVKIDSTGYISSP